MKGESDVDLEQALLAQVLARIPGATGIERFERMTGGASKGIWGFDAIVDGARRPIVLRRAPGGVEPQGDMLLPVRDEAALLEVFAGTDVPVPRVYFITDDDSPLGAAFAMDRLKGVADPLAVLHAPDLEPVRAVLARRLGEVAARIQSVSPAGLPPLPRPDLVGRLRAHYEASFAAYPSFELGFRWLEDNRPQALEPVLVHGDFRVSNFMVTRDGLGGVLDWEMAHLGDPMEDMAWLCVPSWRFGSLHKVVGGVGELDDLIAGYESIARRPFELPRFRYYLVYSVLWWGVAARLQYSAYVEGTDRSIERANIGRRMTEAELDLLDLLEGP